MIFVFAIIGLVVVAGFVLNVVFGDAGETVFIEDAGPDIIIIEEED